jgi:hypothetical protein
MVLFAVNPVAFKALIFSKAKITAASLTVLQVVAVTAEMWNVVLIPVYLGI